jgi:hypothetical protein
MPSDAKLGAVRTLIETAPDAALSSLRTALGPVQVGPMAAIRELVEGEQLNRAFRSEVFQPLLPLFGPRPPFAGPSFAPGALGALWRALQAQRPELIKAAVAARADWRPGDGAPETYDDVLRGAAELLRAGAVPEIDAAAGAAIAAAIDLGPLARGLLDRLPDWMGKATDERIAALKLAFRDATALAEDATPRLLEIVLAHLPEPWLILRLIAVLTDRAGDRYLSSSELAPFGQRLLADVEARIDRVRNFDAQGGGEGALAVARDVVAACSCMAEMEHSVDLSRDGPWGSRVMAARKSLAANVESRLRETDALVAQALPLATVRIAGRMTRPAPKLTADPDARLVERARALLVLVHESRATAAVGGYGALRNQVAEKVTERLNVYADELLHLLNAGEAADEARAQAYLALAAEFLGYVADPQAAQIVRRRAAVAGAASHPSQDVA